MKIELLESLKRTDSYINNADLKASFSLVTGVTFFGIFTSIFFNISESVNTDIKYFIYAIQGISLTAWIYWLIRIISVFLPDVTSSEYKSVISFVSIKLNNNNIIEFKESLSNINIEDDLSETLWICSNICMQKLERFKKSLFWLSLSLCSSILSISLILFVIELKNLGYL